MQRIRLGTAAIALRSAPGRSITDVALSYGYRSPDGFSRAFLGHFGLRPSDWDRVTPLQERKIGRVDDEFPTYTTDQLRSYAKERGWSVELIDLPEREIAYVRVADAYRNYEEVVVQ